MTAVDPADAALWVLAYVDAMENNDRAGESALVDAIGVDSAIARLGGAAAGSMELIASSLGMSYAQYSASMRAAFLLAEES